MLDIFKSKAGTPLKRIKILTAISCDSKFAVAFRDAKGYFPSLICDKSRLDEEIEMARSVKRELIRLISTAGTGYFYTTIKRKGTDKLLLKKYDPKIRKHVEFKEGKIK